MNFEDIKERLREAFQSFLGQVRETSAWNQLVEKYNELSPQAQKGALGGGAFAAVCLLMLIPSCMYMSASSNVDDFESKKQLLRDFYRIHRTASALPPAPVPLSTGDLRNRAQNVITAAQLQPEQVAGITDFDNKPQASSWIPKSLEEAGISVSLKKLNLAQIVDIGQRLQQIQNSAKMTGVEVRAQAADPHYFDVVYKLVAFNLPPDTSSKDKGGKKGSSPFPKKKPAGEEGD